MRPARAKSTETPVFQGQLSRERAANEPTRPPGGCDKIATYVGCWALHLVKEEQHEIRMGSDFGRGNDRRIRGCRVSDCAARRAGVLADRRSGDGREQGEFNPVHRHRLDRLSRSELFHGRRLAARGSEELHADHRLPATRSASEDYVRVQGKNPPRGGGAGFPIQGEPRTQNFVNGPSAWTLNAQGQPQAQDDQAEIRQFMLWVSPHGFIKAAMQDQNAQRRRPPFRQDRPDAHAWSASRRWANTGRRRSSTSRTCLSAW